MNYRCNIVLIFLGMLLHVAAVGSKSKSVRFVAPDESQIPTISFGPGADEAPDDQRMHVRVLLEEKSDMQPLSRWQITAQGKIAVIDLENENNCGWADSVTVYETAGGIGIEDDKGRRFELMKSVRIQPVDGYFKLKDQWYQGSLYFFKRGVSTLVVNNLDVEDYLFSVVKSEGYPGWSLEVNKVFAVASRTYVINKVLEARKKNKLYHIKNTNVHQRYDGYHKDQVIKQAVEQTRGIFLTYENQPIVAMFDICCGGVTPSKMSGVDFKQAPYLARSYPCTSCKSYKVYSWHMEYRIDALEARLKKDIPSLKRCKDLIVAKKDGAGLVKRLSIKAGSGYHSVAGKKIYSILDGVKSFCYSVQKKNNKLVFTGRGYGHHLGLCQWGARKMIEEGWDYKNVLLFYYPGTEFVRLV
jgi:stage II sporulation protein D